MASPHRKPLSSNPPMYLPSHQGGVSKEYINVEPGSFSEAGDRRSSTTATNNTSRSSVTYLPPPFPPPDGGGDTDTRQTFAQRHRKSIAVIRYLTILLLITTCFVAPVVFLGGVKQKRDEKNLRYYISVWLLITWGCACVSNIFINLFPYLFRFVAGWVNPGHVKYWRIFRFMRLSVTLLGAAIGAYVSFIFVIVNNKKLHKRKESGIKKGSFEWEDILKSLIINADKTLKKPADAGWEKILKDVLSILIIWAVLFLLEKIAMLYISIHYHYRADGNRIEKSKRTRGALATLYEASVSVYPTFREPFCSEDAIIHDMMGSGKGPGALLGKLGSAGNKVMNGVENFLNPNEKSHWFKSASTYSIVDRALEHQNSSAALAKRIWMSLVTEGRDALTVHDVVEVLGPHRKADAENSFRVIDENQNGDVTLNEIVLTVLETGITRHSVYQGMTDINRAINTLDWICVVLTAMTVTIYAVVRYVPALKTMKDAAGFAALGLTWGLGRSVYEFINGCIFIFFKHAYDIGDRIEIYNPQASLVTSVVVTRISILFTVFRRVDNGKDLQMSNDRLNLKRIENVTRSGANREELSIFVDFNTTFTDIQYLKMELEAFLSSKENSRDYQPGCEIRVASIHEMNKLELKCSFVHKSNWSNEELRRARSSKFMCALVAAIRKIPIVKPGSLPIPVKVPVMEDAMEEMAYDNLTLIPVTSDNTSQGTLSNASGAQINSWVGHGTTGLRRRPEQIPSAVFYGR